MSTPPFAPPYKARIVTDGQERWVDVAADGTQTDTAAPPAVLDFTTPVTPSAKPAAERAAKPGVVMLKVPYAEKDQAKGLGARWDATRKKWYVPAGVDPAAFSQWMAD